MQRNVFNGPTGTFDPSGALDDFQHLALRPQHTFAPPSLANTAHPQKQFSQPSASPPKPSFPHHSAGFAPGAVGYGTSFPDGGVARGGAAIPYPNIGHYPQGSTPVNAGQNAPAQPWAPHLQQQQLQHNLSNSAGQIPRRDMLQLHVPVRAQSMPGIPVAAQPSPPPPKQHSMSQTQLSQAQKPSETPSGTQWAEHQAAQACKEQLAMSNSCLVELKSDAKAKPAMVKPSDPGQRPVLKIQPRSKPLEMETPTDKPEPAAPHQAMAAPAKPSTGGVKERPKLNLKPRSKPTGTADPALAPQERKSSVFGSALPREVVLNNRGESVPQEPSVPKATQGDSVWHTVHKKKGHHGPNKTLHGHNGRGPVRRASSSPEDDPFFCDYSPPNHSLSQLISSFDSSGNGGGFSGGPCSLQVEDEFPFMKRSLPTRTDEFF